MKIDLRLLMLTIITKATLSAPEYRVPPIIVGRLLTATEAIHQEALNLWWNQDFRKFYRQTDSASRRYAPKNVVCFCITLHAILTDALLSAKQGDLCRLVLSKKIGTIKPFEQDFIPLAMIVAYKIAD